MSRAARDTILHVRGQEPLSKIEAKRQEIHPSHQQSPSIFVACYYWGSPDCLSGGLTILQLSTPYDISWCTPSELTLLFTHQAWTMLAVYF